MAADSYRPAPPVVRGGGAHLGIAATNDIVWHTNTYGHPGATATMQTDGNFVVYHNGTPLWHAGTYNNPGAHLNLQNDSNLVIYTTQGTPLWWYALSPPP